MTFDEYERTEDLIELEQERAAATSSQGTGIYQKTGTYLHDAAGVHARVLVYPDASPRSCK